MDSKVSGGKNFLRATLGQGLGLGWGDEAEAWVRSKLGDREYEDIFNEINNEYGQYSDDNPITSLAGEFAGGAIPGIVSMLFPGGQAFAPATGARTVGTLSRLAKSVANRSFKQNLARSTGAGAVTGGISGAGTQDEDRFAGATVGTAVGGGLGMAIPFIGTGVSRGASWIRERLNPGDEVLDRAAAGRVHSAMKDSELEPSDIQARMDLDRSLEVPSMVGNASPELASLTENLAQRSGPSSARIGRSISTQADEARDRVYANIDRGLKPGDYFNDEQTMVTSLRENAKTMYDNAYSMGGVDDPRIMEVLSTPQFKSFFEKAKGIADLEATAAKLRGEDPSKYRLQEIYKQGEVDPTVVQAMRDMGISDKAIEANIDAMRGAPQLVAIPDVRTLDYIKRGIDASIDSGFRGEGMSKAEANALKQLRREFVSVIDEKVPEYAAARGAYAGDMEVLDALRSGMGDFGKMTHEQVSRTVQDMSVAERQAFRTGVARDFYSSIMNPSTNANFARRVINSPETTRKLRPLFDNNEEFNLFKAALERESEIFGQAQKILGGSPTSRREQMRGILETDPIGSAAADLVNGGMTSSIIGMVTNYLRSGAVTKEVADRMAKMLTSTNPDDVAAVVQRLEQYSSQLAPRAVKATGASGAVTTGAAASWWGAPSGPAETQEDQ